MPHVIDYNANTYELHVSVDEDGNVIIASRIKGTRGAPTTHFALTPFEAGLFASSLNECGEFADNEVTERQLQAGLGTLTNRS
jgi:hypothetical protein